MNASQIRCTNMGMVRDDAVSDMISYTTKDGTTPLQYAFENHNIRIMANKDNTKFAVTNEKSTKYENSVDGIFMGGCTINHYLVLFVKVPLANKPDYIYRLYYNGEIVEGGELYNGGLNFDLQHPIEALGYYESAEVQKVYWVDGLNPNRFINIIKDPYSYYVAEDSTKLKVATGKEIVYSDGSLTALVNNDNELMYYADGLEHNSRVWTAQQVDEYNASYRVHTIDDLAEQEEPTTFAADNWRGTVYNDNSFDFQGQIASILQVTITKNYDEAGMFTAGVVQYFITYYNKYGVETCIVWNSDLQYISMIDRGAKADEAVSCGFDFEITNIDTSYDYLRIYSTYRSGVNGVVTSKIVADISLSSHASSDVIKFSDLGTEGINFNADDLFYVGGQNVIANTLDYKQDTLFLGDIQIASQDKAFSFTKNSRVIPDLRDGNGAPVAIQEGGVTTGGTFVPFVRWAYKYVSPIAKEDVYQYDSELKESQEEIAGFKWREVYRFGIQFMTNTGEWTQACWLGDKYCNFAPMAFDSDSATLSLETHEPLTPDPTFGYYVAEVPSATGTKATTDGIKYNEVPVYYTKDGCYIATAVVDINAVLSSMVDGTVRHTYTAYRLLMVEPNVSNRRIVTQGVVNPTMFNYTDRYYNRPFSIPSWIFRPRESSITNRHYDTLPLQDSTYAELQGIVERQVPGFVPPTSDTYNAYMLVIGANAATLNKGFVQWKLIYYNCGTSDLERAERAYLAMWSGQGYDGAEVPSNEYETVADLLLKYQDSVGLGFGNSNTQYCYSPIPSLYPLSAASLTKAALVTLLQNGYFPAYVYGKSYKVVSSGFEVSTMSKKGTVSNSVFHSWERVRGNMIDRMTKDMRATTTEEVGPILAGKIVIPAETLPSAEELKDLANISEENAAAIGMAIVAAVATAAAIVISAVSMGTLTGAALIAASIAVSAAVSMCAGVAIGAASVAAAAIINQDNLAEIYKRLLAKGFVTVGGEETNLSSRRQRSLHVAQNINKFFIAEDYVANSSVQGSWYVPILYGEKDMPYASPFKTKHPYTETGCLGEDWNAVIRVGKISILDESEEDLKRKQNLFCIDESIVTLNAPDVEEISTLVNNSEALSLDLVGVIPIDAVYGTYNMQVSNGLNSNSQVIQSKNVSRAVNSGTGDLNGLLNGDLYQDFKDESADATFVADDRKVVANESSGIYRTFMWNRSTSAGFWFPGISLYDAFDQPITSPRSKLNHKIFANLRYSTNTSYYIPYSIDIEAPQACLDSQTMLKMFNYGGSDKTYYECVDTISVNTDVYPLIADSQIYPSSAAAIEAGGIKDPVQIRYRETPHILIPFKWDSDQAYSSTLLPAMSYDDRSFPEDLYEEIQENPELKLYGVGESIPTDATETYYYLPISGYDAFDVDPWGETLGVGEFTFAKLLKLSGLLRPEDGLYAQVHAVAEDLGVSEDDVISMAYGAYGNDGYVGDKLSIYWSSIVYNNVLLDKSKAYLLRTSPSTYYTLKFVVEGEGVWGWTSSPVAEVPVNSKLTVITDQADGYNIYTPYDYHIDQQATPEWVAFYPAYTEDTSVSPEDRIDYSLVLPTCHDTVADCTGFYNIPSKRAWRIKKHPDTQVTDLWFEAINTSYAQKASLPAVGSYVYAKGGDVWTPTVLCTDTEATTVTLHASALPAFIQYDVEEPADESSWHVISADGEVFQVVKHVDFYIGSHLEGIAIIVKSVANPPAFSKETLYYATQSDLPSAGDLENILSTDPFRGSWSQSVLPWGGEIPGQYLFLGELVKKEFDYSSWNGGTEEKALQQLVWNVASQVTPIDQVLTKSWGDTYYQRWDCLKTYPYTEDDPNSIVEELSFMVESRKNLDGRSDVNRGIANLINTRPSNTVYNDVYEQQDNFFNYQILDSKFDKKHFEADVMWSLSKSNLDDIDKWTSLVATNEMSLDGRYGAVRKVLNVNDTLVAFQDTGIAQIKYNESTALNTTSGLPLQLGNTGKVEGYRMISGTTGCHNKFSINKNSAGVFFADDHSKSFNQMTVNGGMSDISTTAGFSVWFRKNLTGHIWDAKDRDNFRTSYDEVTHDLYLIKRDTCLVYNTLLQRFTSFMDYLDTPMITRMISDGGESGSFAIRNFANAHHKNVVEAWQMFANVAQDQEYGYIYGEFKPYSMEYRLTPDATHDSIFTNYVYTADWTDPTKTVDEDHIFDSSVRRYTTFDIVEAKNEYQYGVMNVLPRINGYNRAMGLQPLKSKFRIWRGDIPRDGYTLGQPQPVAKDRMRNPWIHLKFEKTTSDNSKMTFHDLLVTYYNQYGRF